MLLWWVDLFCLRRENCKHGGGRTSNLKNRHLFVAKQFLTVRLR